MPPLLLAIAKVVLVLTGMLISGAAGYAACDSKKDEQNCAEQMLLISFIVLITAVAI